MVISNHSYAHLQWKRPKLDKEKHKYSLKRKGAAGTVMEPSPVLSDKKFKEKPGAKQNKDSADLRARPHPGKHPP